MDLPYLTEELPGVGGRIKEHLEDFRVEELPLYEPSGEGAHVYFRVEKLGIPTPAAVERIARYMGVRRDQIGVAGLKDARAVTTQMMSLEHADREKLAAFRARGLRVTWTGRHTNKLRTGHLKGNRFWIRIRGAGERDLPAAQEILDVLTQRGVPDYFGHQRFGARGDTADLGEALLRNDLEQFLAIFLGRPAENDPPDCKAAREAFDAGSYPQALEHWPRHYADQRRALAAFKRRSKHGLAVGAVDKRMKRLFISAFQSRLFNRVLAERIQTIDRVLAGDLAQKTDSGGVFPVDNPDQEAPRAAAFEISPTGPLFGARCHLATEESGRIERRIIDECGVRAEDFQSIRSLKVKGGRRALRFRLIDPLLAAGADGYGPFLELSYVGPSGSYATVALREIMKTD